MTNKDLRISAAPVKETDVNAGNAQGQDDRKPVSFQEAKAMLPDGSMIHTFRSDNPMMLIGADWKRATILALIREKGAECSGPSATAMNHGLWVNDGQGRGLFIETRKAPSVPNATKDGK